VVAAGVLTWLVFWMRRQARAIKGELEQKVDLALAAGSSGGALAMVAFLAVLREGIEAALFLVAAATDADGARVVLGAVAGLSIAVVLGLLVYAGGRRLPMRAFFQVTGIVVILFAAGLVARTVMLLQLAGDLGSLNPGAFDLRSIHWLSTDSETGRFLMAMFGWDARPSIEQLVLWAAYLLPVTALFLAGSRSGPASAAPVAPIAQQQPDPAVPVHS
jgi:high-affinity iron transporter